MICLELMCRNVNLYKHKPIEPVKPTEPINKEDDVIKTGDITNAQVWILLIVGVAGIVLREKKRRETEE